MSEKVQRYRPVDITTGETPPGLVLEVDEDGAWRRNEDYEALEAKVERLAKQNKALVRQLKDCLQGVEVSDE